ncbi:MAG: excinuclease ABC subunit UvrC [Chthoniobacterales bacterium]|nr:excinuclease ABC subunit UvrC [Chthoniobacterales bacterium]
MAASAEQPDLRSRLHDVPHKPGVYLMRDRLNRVIYVGKARDLRKRLAQYFTPARSRLADLKTRALLDSVWDFAVHVVRSDAEAVLLEGKLIKEYRPKYNISFRDDKNFLQLRVNLDDPFPKFTLVRLRKEDGARYFGPYAHSGALRTTMEVLKRKYGLRSCRPRVPGEKDYRHCHDDIIKNCSAPCIGKIRPEDYRERVLQACAFLEGRSREIPEELEAEMSAAAKALDFEKAAALRDMISALRQTSKRERRFLRGSSLPAGGDLADDLRALGEALGLPKPPAIMECFDISNITSTHIVASMVRFRDGAPDRQAYRRYRIRTVGGQDDFASMAEVVRRRYGRLLAAAREEFPEAAEFSQEEASEAVGRLALPFAIRIPDLVIVDGGRGQLSSACGEFVRLGLRGQPVIGLAKEREEIYFPNDPQPLRLPHESGALQLLQRIRDEAHRVANGYHQLLMKRRVSESVLDDIPGVSHARKQALLRVFGSVERLRKAEIEDMAKVSGVGARLAREIKDALSGGRRA